MRWRVQIWRRDDFCSLNPKSPARYSLFWEGAVEADVSVVAMSRAAEGRKLQPAQWTGMKRPAYIVRTLRTLA